ncbi:Peptidase C15 [Fusarium austroafricanum]|uniref:Peptidase C15 n=1 Tax=Fusarium austroafricanum TaxID=2364996 RepID=A0A8H4KXU0_9HYPO|nr:Peptidase C15 [Fusarium austroafricanum]
MLCEKEYIVVVTAAAPFKGNETNPTQDVKKLMPDRIERRGHIPIKIIKYHTDFRNVIADMCLIPPLWNKDKRVYDPNTKPGKRIHVDAMLHLGMNGVNYWQVENRARRDGYDWVGDDGVPLPKCNGVQGGRWEGLPEVLRPIFDVDAVVDKLHQQLPDTPTQASTDAGLLYCEFIFYTSLAALYRREEPARALFLHHPGKKTTEQDIEEGVMIATVAICSMIDQLEAAFGYSEV